MMIYYCIIFLKIFYGGFAMKRQIINIVNFIRACEPRMEMDLFTPVIEQIRLMKEHKLNGTFLVQYDTMLDSRFTDILKELDPRQFELGVWHEIVQPETEKLGIRWTGRYPWDWHVHCGFAQGYTKLQRESIADELFAKFKEIFGYYPRVFGSWLFDTHTVRYLSDKYGLDAVINCKEQYGTDGYTLWGGYYGQGYYPSRTNVFMPAQTDSEQMDVPLFRMLGSDPVYQYDFGLDADSGANTCQGVVTLEPVYCGGTGGGGVPKWVDWYMRENFNGDCLSFGYAQAGQENPFGWKAMGEGLTYQFALFDKLRNEGKIEVEKLGDTGRWFKNEYTSTPASTITAYNAFDDDGKQSVWYSSKFYRANIYSDNGLWRIRDLHVFNEKHPDPFEDKVCESNEASYEALPVADGNRYSGCGVIAGIYITDTDGENILAGGLRFTDKGEGKALLELGEITVLLEERRLTVTAEREFILENRIGKQNDHLPEVIYSDDNTVKLKYQGTEYGIRLTEGSIDGVCRIKSENKRVSAEII